MGDPELSPFTDFSFLFLSIVLEGAPFIFFGTLISGFIDAYLPPGLIDRWLPRKRNVAIMISGLLGAVLPVCECAVVPVIRRLIRKGLPVSCAITYMLSAPIINPIVVVSTVKAFGSDQEQFFLRKTAEQLVDGPWFVTCSRLLIAYLVTVTVGMIVQRMRPSTVLKPSVYAGLETVSNGGHEHEHEHEHEGDGETADQAAKGDRLIAAMRTAMRDFVDTAMYFVIGVAITSMFKTYVSEDLVLVFNQSEWIGVNLMMILAFVLSLCSTSDAFVAANFPAPLSGKLAFLVFGPMMDVKLVFMYLAVFRHRFVIGLAAGLFVAIGTLCYFWVRIG